MGWDRAGGIIGLFARFVTVVDLVCDNMVGWWDGFVGRPISSQIRVIVPMFVRIVVVCYIHYTVARGEFRVDVRSHLIFSCDSTVRSRAEPKS